MEGFNFDLENKSQKTTERASPVSQEVLISRELLENDLIIPEDNIELVKQILENMDISFELNQYTKELPVGDGQGKIPAEYLLTIFDSENSNSPASSETIKQVFKHLKDKGVVIRYGKTPSL